LFSIRRLPVAVDAGARLGAAGGLDHEPIRAHPGFAMGSLAERRAVLTAALGFMGLNWRQPVPPVVLTLARWMNSWAGLGAVVAGMGAQGFNLELKEFPWGWRANFYPTGIAHSVVVGSAYEPAPWTGVQKAAWEALGRAGPS
jgi:hypothetical protein